MKKYFAILAALFMGVSLTAQDLPVPSPSAEFEQRVGLTDIKVMYSRPQMKGREIFGDLVPYDRLWRTGANKATSIEFSTDVQFNKMPVKAGTYSLITIPSEGKWTIILNRETEMWGVGSYDEGKDVLRTMISAKELPYSVETFTIEIENIEANKAELAIKWEQTAVNIPISVEVDEIAEANIAKAIEEDGDNWRVYRSAASYYINKGSNYDEALKHINNSLELDPDQWYSYWVKAEALHGLGKNKEAKESGNKAIAMGKAAAEKDDREFTYGEGLMAEMKAW